MRTKEQRTVLSPELVKRIDAVGRKAVAIDLGMSYSTLNNKCWGGCTVSQEEIDAIEKAVDALRAEAKRRAE